MGHICECWNCDGEGEYEDDVECDCPYCFNGEHCYEWGCGQTVDGVPCEKCEGRGNIKKFVKCEECDGDGLDHNFSKKAMQRDLDGNVLMVRGCEDCGFSELKMKVGEVAKCINEVKGEP